MTQLERRPTSVKQSKPTQEQPYDREAYKRSVWASTIDAAYRIIVPMALENEGELPSHVSPLADWANWMVREGHRLSNLEVAEKTKVLLRVSDDEYQAIIQELTEGF